VRWSTRVLLSLLAAVLVPLIVLALVGLPSVSSQLSQSAEADFQRWTRTIAALVDAALEDLQREARLLARDPAVIQGVMKGDWGTLARGASPRMLSLTLERVADLVLIVDERNAPLVQVPAASVPAGTGLPVGSPAPIGAIQLVSGVPMLLGVVPIVQDGRSLGTVVVGRKFEGLAKRLGANSPRVELLLLAEGAPAYTTLPEGTSGVRWAEATRAGRVELSGASYFLRPVGRWSDVALWLLAPDAELRAAQGLVSTWVVGFLLFTGCATFVVSWLLARRVLQPIEAIGEGARRVAAGDFDTRVSPGRGGELGDIARAFNKMGVFLERGRREVEHRNRELQALNAVAFTLNRSVDLVPTVEETLEVVRRVTEMDMAALYQAAAGGQTLSLMAQRGLSPELEESFGIRSVPGSSLGQAMKTGRLTVVDGPSGSPDRRHQTQIALPILVKGEVWGVMILAASAAREFTPEETHLIEAVAYQVGAAVERAALFAETREKEERLESLVKLAQTVTARLDVGEVLDGVIRTAAGLLPDSSVRLWVAEEDRLLLRGESGAGAAAPARGKTTFAFGEGLVGHVAQAGEPLVIERLLDDPRTLNVEWLRQEGCVSFAGVPLLFQNRVLGVLAIVTRRLTRFSKEEIDLLMSFATQAAIAMENARLYAATTRRGKRLETLAELTQTLTATLSVEEVLDRVVGSAVELFGSSVSRLWLVDEGGETLSLRAHAGSLSEDPGIMRFRVGEGLVGQIVATKAPLVIADLREDARAVNRERHRIDGVISYAGAPMLLGDRALGALGIALREPHEFSEEEVSLLQSLANHAAIAIENARLYQSAARRAARMRTLAEMGRLLVSTFDVKRILETVATRCRESLDISDVGIFSLDVESSELCFLHGFGSREAFWRTHRLRIGEGVAGRAVAENRPVWTEDVLNDPTITLRPETRAQIGTVGTRAVLALPLSGERPFGVLVVHREAGHRFSDEEKEYLTTFANQVAVALENARLFSLEQARRAQVEALGAIERELVAELIPERLLDLIIERASALLKARGVVFLLDETGSTLVPRSSYGMPPKVRDLRIPLGVGIAGTAAVERRGLLGNDFASSAYAASLAEHGIDTLGSVHLIAQPLISRDRLLGVIALNREEGGRRFTQTEFETFGGFAAQAAIALENARLYREAKEYGDRLRALDEVNRLVSSSLQVKEVLKNIAQAVSTFFEAPQAHVWVVTPEGQRLRRSVTVGDPEVAAGFADEVALGEGAVGWVVQHREPILWTRIEDDRRILRASWAIRHGLRYLTAYPITLGARVLGAFVMYRSAPHPVTPETRSLLGSLAAQAAIALDNARLYAETTRRLRETQALLEVAEILSSTLDVKRLLKQVTIKAAQVCQVDRCTIVFWEGNRTIPLMSQFADGRKAPDLWAKFVAMQPFAPQEVPAHAIAIDTKRPVIIPDTADTDLIPREWIEAYGLRAYLVVPLIRQDRVVGALNLDYTERGRTFERWQVDLAVTIAGQLALALDNSRLYAEIRERLKETETLLSVARVLSLNLPLQEGMRQVAREVGRAFQADMVGAYFLDSKKEALVPLAGYHVPKNLFQAFLDRPFHISRFPILQEAWEARKPVWTSDAMSDPRFDRDFLGAIRPRAVLFAPTLVRGEIVGGLFLVWWSSGRTFTSAELRLVEGVASQVGLALENADLVRQTQDKLRETETLLNVSRALSTTLDLEPLLRHFLREVTHIIDADSVGVWLLDPATGQLEPVVGFRVPRNLLDALRTVRIDPAEITFYADGFRSKRVMVSSNVPEDPRIPAALKAVAPHRVQLFAPIVAKDRVIGSFIAVWWERTREFSERELALVEAMGIQAGVAVENAGLFQENQRKLEELSVLHELSRAVTGQLDLAELVGAIRGQVARVLDARNMLILLYDEARQEVEVALRLLEGEERPNPRRYPVGDGLVTRLVESGRPIRTDNYAAECRREGVRPFEDSLKYPNWLGAPMVAGDKTIGGLILRSNARAFTAADERLLLNIASLAALAFRSARLFDERTRAYQQLAAAQDQLIRTEKLRALGEMASGVAHDFNNLLASILGRAQLLLRKVEDPKLRQWLEVIERAATDGAQTVRRIQEFARIRRDQPFVPVDLNRVVKEALEVTQSRWGQEAQSQGVTIEVTTTLDPIPQIAGDPAELREALTNLVLNAVDAMPEGGTLSLTTRVEAGDVVVKVSDTGAGISEAVQRQIFDPFFTTKGPKGTGLGLSITYGIVSRHGGLIAVESAEGQGATFSLTFPVSEAEPEPPSPPALPSTSPVRCLVVDDDQLVLEAMGDVLTMAGHSAVLLLDGREAIARFKAEPFDLVLTDLAMPGVNGWQLARAVKDHAPLVPVLLVTGLGVELSPEELLAQGVDAVLSKPVKLEDILSAVGTYGSRSQRQPPASVEGES